MQNVEGKCDYNRGWDCLAKMHALHSVEVELLMSCRVVPINELWQVEALQSKLIEACLSCDPEAIADLQTAQFAINLLYE